jgi:hypothetical protein
MCELLSRIYERRESVQFCAIGRNTLSASVVDPDSKGSLDPSGFTIRIRIQEGKKGPEKYKTVKSFMFLSAGCSLLRAEGLSSSLDVLYVGLVISTLQVVDQKRYFFLSAVFS